MARTIDLDAEFNIIKVQQAGTLVNNFVKRAGEMWKYLPAEKKKQIAANSVTFRGLAKLKANLDLIGGLGDGN